MKSKCFFIREGFLSCAHSYYHPFSTEIENLKFYGKDMSPNGMGNNFKYEISCEIENKVEPLSVYLHSIMDHKNFIPGLPLNLEEGSQHSIVYSASNRSMGVATLENMTLWAGKKLEEKESSFTFLKLCEGEKDYAIYMRGKSIQVFRPYHLDCVHRHHNDNLNDKENALLYGKCSNVHGHSYILEVGLEGDVLQPWGVICPRTEWDKIVEQTIIEPYQGQFLNKYLGNTSGEIILEKFYEKLAVHFQPNYKLKLSLRETRRNSFFKGER